MGLQLAILDHLHRRPRRGQRHVRKSPSLSRVQAGIYQSIFSQHICHLVLPLFLCHDELDESSPLMMRCVFW